MNKFNLSLAGAALGLVLAFMVGVHFVRGQPDTPPPDLNCPHLLPQSCDQVRDAFNLARSLYLQGKYELCLTEVAKVHDVIPQYKNSLELKTYCEQGRDLVKQQRDIDAKEKAAHEETAARIEAERRPASAGTYTCRHLSVGNGNGFEDYLNATCDRAKPFAITPLAESRLDYDVCCIARASTKKAKKH